MELQDRLSSHDASKCDWSRAEFLIADKRCCRLIKSEHRRGCLAALKGSGPSAGKQSGIRITGGCERARSVGGIVNGDGEEEVVEEE